MELAAQYWYDQGFLPIPFKQPPERCALVKWSKYQDDQQPRPSWSTVRRWLNQPNINIAVVCSVGGLACLDFDDEIMFWHWRCKYGHIRTRVEKSARGFHVFFKVNERTGAVGAPGLDILERGCVTCAPSLHRSGILYEVWEVSIKGVYGVQSILDVLRTEDIRVVAKTPPQERWVGKEGVLHGDILTNDTHTNDTHTDDTVQSHAVQNRGFLSHSAPLSGRSPDHRTTVQIIKSVIRIEDLIRSSGIELAQSGPRYLEGRCPFHDDHNASFWVDPVLQLCGCHRPDCQAQQYNGKAMDVINFYARLHDISNSEAISILSKLALDNAL